MALSRAISYATLRNPSRGTTAHLLVIRAVVPLHKPVRLRVRHVADRARELPVQLRRLAVDGPDLEPLELGPLEDLREVEAVEGFGRVLAGCSSPRSEVGE